MQEGSEEDNSQRENSYVIAPGALAQSRESLLRRFSQNMISVMPTQRDLPRAVFCCMDPVRVAKDRQKEELLESYAGNPEQYSHIVQDDTRDQMARYGAASP